MFASRTWPKLCPATPCAKEPTQAGSCQCRHNIVLANISEGTPKTFKLLYLPRKSQKVVGWQSPSLNVPGIFFSHSEKYTATMLRHVIFHLIWRDSGLIWEFRPSRHSEPQMCEPCLVIAEPTNDITKIILPGGKGCVLGTAHKIKSSPQIRLYMKQRLGFNELWWWWWWCLAHEGASTSSHPNI